MEKPSPEFFEKELGELLALIHRDGGHYVSEHGWKAAVEDAKEIMVSCMLREDREVLARALTWWLDNAHDQAGAPEWVFAARQLLD